MADYSSSSRELFASITPGNTRQLGIYDSKGQLVRTLDVGPADKSFPVNDISPGIYVIRSDAGNTKRIVIGER